MDQQGEGAGGRVRRRRRRRCRHRRRRLLVDAAVRAKRNATAAVPVVVAGRPVAERLSIATTARSGCDIYYE